MSSRALAWAEGAHNDTSAALTANKEVRSPEGREAVFMGARGRVGGKWDVDEAEGGVMWRDAV